MEEFSFGQPLSACSLQSTPFFANVASVLLQRTKQPALTAELSVCRVLSLIQNTWRSSLTFQIQKQDRRHHVSLLHEWRRAASLRCGRPVLTHSWSLSRLTGPVRAGPLTSPSVLRLPAQPQLPSSIATIVTWRLSRLLPAEHFVILPLSLL